MLTIKTQNLTPQKNVQTAKTKRNQGQRCLAN